jgi:putative nucleotidyltransferase with HDIG domain
VIRLQFTALSPCFRDNAWVDHLGLSVRDDPDQLLCQSFKGRDEAFIKTSGYHLGTSPQRIAAMVGYRDMEKAHLVGIIHDIGKVFLGHYCRDEYASMLEMISGKPYTTYEAEAEVFGTSHCEVGLCLAQRWNFPPVYCDIISYHHNSEMATEDPLLTAIISLADFCSLARTPASGIAQASTLGRSEENAWAVLSQLSNKQLAGGLEDFMHLLDKDFEVTANEVKQLFDTMALR